MSIRDVTTIIEVAHRDNLVLRYSYVLCIDCILHPNSISVPNMDTECKISIMINCFFGILKYARWRW